MTKISSTVIFLSIASSASSLFFLILQKEIHETTDELIATGKIKQYEVPTQAQIIKFETWKQAQNKTYRKAIESEEEAKKNFIENDKRIKRHNSHLSQAYNQGHNEYSDKSYEENKKLRTGLTLPSPAFDKWIYPKVRGSRSAVQKLPQFVNHTKYLQPIKDQKDCGACSVFATTALVEFISRSGNKSFLGSEQNLIDCDKFSFGCSGGWPSKALQYIQNFGISDGRKYKFVNSRQSCLRNKYPAVMNVSKTCENQLQGNEEALKALVSKHPVVVTYEATVNFMYYRSGIFADSSCGGRIGHALTVVGYGTDKKTKQDYWIVRNSWGESWGMNGYGLVARNKKNMCGIASWAFYVC